MKDECPCGHCRHNTGLWMQDPCFPCDQDHDLFSGASKKRYSHFRPKDVLDIDPTDEVREQ